MSRKVWIILIASTLALVLVFAAGVAAFILVPRYRATQSLAKARQLVSEGTPELARRPYKEYLYKNGNDIAVLDEYIGVCEGVISDRRRVLADAGRIMTRLIQLEPENPTRRTQLFDFYRKYRFWSELESAINLYGGDDLAALEYDRVVAVQEQGRLDQAITELHAYIEIGHDLRDTPLRKARVHVALRDLNAADDVFPPLLKKFPDDSMLRVHYAAYLLDQDKIEEAQAQLASVPADLHAQTDFVVASIRINLAREQFAEALTLAEKALAATPDNLDLQLNYVLALERSGKRDVAMDYVQRMDPVRRIDTPGFIMFLTEMRLEAGDADGADEARKMYIQAYPDQQSVDQYLSGRILLEQRNLQAARDKFAIAAEMNPNLHRANYFLAICELELGEKSKARAPLEQFLSSNPTDQQARRLWARNFGTAPSISELQARSNRLLAETKSDVNELIFTIEDLLQHRQEAEQSTALRLIEKVIAIAPRDPRGYSALAGFRLERGEIPEAEKVLQDAADAGVDPSSFSLIRTSILLVKGDKAGAMASAKSYLEKSPSAEARTWGAFFARQGYFPEGDELVKLYGGEGSPDSENEDGLLFRLSLALQYGQLDAARERVAEAEAARGQDPALAPSLNRMRLALAEGLVVNSNEIPREEVDGLLAKVRQSEPQNDGLKIVEARLMLKGPLPDVQGAGNLVTEISAESPVYLQGLQIQAEIASMQGDQARVESLCNSILERSPGNTQVMHLLADAQLEGAQLEGDQREEARRTYEQILSYDRSDARAMRILVRMYEQMGFRPRADEMFARFKESGRNRPGHEAQVEELRKFLNRPGSEAPEPAAANGGAPSASATYSELTSEVTSLVNQKNFGEAIAKVQAYLKENPDRAEPWVFLGQVILAQGEGANLDAASTAFTRAQLIIAEYKPALKGQIEVQARSNPPIAISMCERYLRTHDRDPDVMFRLATLLAAGPGRREEALAWVDKAIAIETQPTFNRFRAFLLTQMARADEAIDELTELIKVAGPATAEDEITLTEAYLVKKDLSGAREHLQAAKKLIPEDDVMLAERFKKLEALVAAGGVN
jgi:tetratricopeptide (TPR) repeat protein